jgi:hypothetical protein
MEKSSAHGLTRRSALKTLSCLLCAIPLTSISLTGRLHAQTRKVSKEQAAYQDQPKGNQMCSNCAHFLPPAACAVVAGEISPNGWSKYWAAARR